MSLSSLLIVFKSGRKSVIPDVAYFEYISKLDKWAVGSLHFRSHEKLFENSKLSFIGWLKV